MVETVACVTSLSESCSRTQIGLAEVNDHFDVRREQRDLFEEMAQRAITSAVDAPHSGGAVGRGRLEFDGPAGSEIADRKSELMPASYGAGAAPSATPTEAAKEAMDHVSQRVRVLYLDLTKYHVAWKIGHKVQQDTSQILRGQ